MPLPTCAVTVSIPSCGETGKNARERQETASVSRAPTHAGALIHTQESFRELIKVETRDLMVDILANLQDVRHLNENKTS